MVIMQIGVPLLLLVIGFVAGKITQSQHYRSIREREGKYSGTPAVSLRTVHDPRAIVDATLATGSVVVSVDHYKRFLMFFRRIFGGEVTSYSSLIDRGRREAVLRMRESCPSADLFVNFRMETSTISNGRGKTVGTVEVLAYSTAIRFAG